MEKRKTEACKTDGWARGKQQPKMGMTATVLGGKGQASLRQPHLSKMDRRCMMLNTEQQEQRGSSVRSAVSLVRNATSGVSCSGNHDNTHNSQILFTELRGPWMS